MNKKELTLEVIKRLKKIFPEPKIALNFGNEFELLVAVILSAQCTDERVNKVTPKLFKRYKSVKDYAECKVEELEKLIFSTGFYRAKAKNIRGAAEVVVKKFGGSLPRTMSELLELPGVARKTANVVLHAKIDKGKGVEKSYEAERGKGVEEAGGSGEISHYIVSIKGKGVEEAGGSGEAGIVVDTHVARVAGRLGLVSKRDSEAKKAVKIEMGLMKIVPQNDWGDFSHLLILHGRATCNARKPNCKECVLKNICPSAL